MMPLLGRASHSTAFHQHFILNHATRLLAFFWFLVFGESMWIASSLAKHTHASSPASLAGLSRAPEGRLLASGFAKDRYWKYIETYWNMKWYWMILLIRYFPMFSPQTAFLVHRHIPFSLEGHPDQILRTPLNNSSMFRLLASWKLGVGPGWALCHRVTCLALCKFVDVFCFVAHSWAKVQDYKALWCWWWWGSSRRCGADLMKSIENSLVAMECLDSLKNMWSAVFIDFSCTGPPDNVLVTVRCQCSYWEGTVASVWSVGWS